MVEMNGSGLSTLGVVEELLRSVGSPISDNDDGRTFGEIGVDSLARMEISKRVQDDYGADIEARLTEETTPAGLREMISGLTGGQAGRRRGSAEPARTVNHVDIAAPIAFVWAALVDVAGWPDLFTEYRSVEVLERSENAVTFRLTLHPDEHGTVWSWVSRRRWNRDTWTARAWRLEKGPFAFMRLVWTFESIEADRTRMTWAQEFRMKPDAPLNDAGMTARVNANSVTEMATIAHRIEQRRHERRTWADTPAVRTRGGEMRTLIGPHSCGAGFGISGFVELAPGEQVDEHLHPYSEEHLLIVSGIGEIDVDDEMVELGPKEALLVPRNVRHRLRNAGSERVVAVFALSPLAPRPELGHVDTERNRDAVADVRS